MKSVTGIEIFWGVIYIVLSVGWIYFESTMGWHGPEIDKHAGFSILFALPAMFVYWLALIHKRKSHYHGFMTWQQGFISGIVLTLVIFLLAPLVQILYHKVISPEYLPNMVEFTTKIENRDRAEMESFFTLGNFIFQAMKDALLWGVVASALAALLTMRKKTI